MKFDKKFNSKLGIPACAYPYLYEDIRIVDFECVMDEIATMIGFSMNFIDDKILKEKLKYFCGLAWHIGGSIRGRDCISEQEVLNALDIYNEYNNKLGIDRKRFTLPIGSMGATYLELIRNKFKLAIRTLYYVEKRFEELNIKKEISQNIFDLLNICSNLFYVFSLWVRVYNNENIETYYSKSFGKQKDKD